MQHCPCLILWASSKLVSMWLNRSPRAHRNQVSESDAAFLRQTALGTWRYFAEFSTAEHNWLVPDNVQEDPEKIAAANFADEPGIPADFPASGGVRIVDRTVLERALHTLGSLKTMEKLERTDGHFLGTGMTRIRFSR